MKNQALIDEVIEQLKLDIAMGDWTAIEELLTHVPEQFLDGFLSDCVMPSDDTYDEYGVNTKNSFNTPPKGESK